MSDCLQHFVHFSMNSMHTPLEKSCLHQQLKDELQKLQVERKKYSKYKILLELAGSVCNKDSKLPLDVKEKLANLLNTVGLASDLQLEDGHMLLGLTDLCYELNYGETSLLKECVERELIEKFNALQVELQSLMGTDLFTETSNDCSELDLSVEEKVLLEFKKELTSLQENYSKNLQTYSDLLEELTNLRTKQLPTVCEAKVKECKLLSSLQDLKAKIQCETVRVDMFTETNESLIAYRKILEDIQSQHVECVEEIKRLKELKEKYRQVDSKEFRDILKTYLEYKEALEKTRFLYRRLTSK